VNSNLKEWEILQAVSKIKREHFNELLFAMDCAPFLSVNIDPEGLFEAVGTGRMKVDNIVVEAGKSKNTKQAKKVRETWNGSDVLRELTSTADRAMRPLAMKYRGVTSTRSSATIDRQFDQMMEDLNREKPDCVVSGDISSWSAKGDRNAWHEHHDYVLHTARIPEGVSFKNLRADIKRVCSKMGVHENWDSNIAMYHGFTATGDTLLNQHLCLYSIRVAKERGIFTEEEACFAAGLIDYCDNC